MPWSLAWYGTKFDSARTVGTLAGVGLLTAPGLGTAYAAVGLCYVAGFLLTFGVPRAALWPLHTAANAR